MVHAADSRLNSSERDDGGCCFMLAGVALFPRDNWTCGQPPPPCSFSHNDGVHDSDSHSDSTCSDCRLQ